MPKTKETDHEKASGKGNGHGGSKGNGKGNGYLTQKVPLDNREKLISEESGEDVYEFIQQNLDITQQQNLVVTTSNRFNILNQERETYNGVVNLRRINHIRRINKFFEGINAKLPVGGLFIGNVETYSLRKRRILRKYPPVFNWMYYTMDFIIKRVFPKLKYTKRIYFLLTDGRNRVLSKAETFGRLYSCGFNLIKEQEIHGQLFFVAQKKTQPAFDYNPTYGPLIRLKRIGKDGKFIKVYKLRTMHAYSEYLQEYIYEKNSLKNNGKFKRDFRITTLGSIMRQFWIDEFPMLINFFRCDMKLVGVRPLSMHYFNLYDDDLKERRIKYRPGLIPPYYADLPGSMEEIQNSERKYLDAYDKSPLLTDWLYFRKAMYNIFFKNARSE